MVQIPSRWSSRWRPAAVPVGQTATGTDCSPLEGSLGGSRSPPPLMAGDLERKPAGQATERDDRDGGRGTIPGTMRDGPHGPAHGDHGGPQTPRKKSLHAVSACPRRSRQAVPHDPSGTKTGTSPGIRFANRSCPGHAVSRPAGPVPSASLALVAQDPVPRLGPPPALRPRGDRIMARSSARATPGA